MQVLIAGCGYVGLALARRLTRKGHSIEALRRPGADPAPLLDAGARPLHADLTQPAGAGGDTLPVPRWDAIVFAAAPAESTEAAYRALYVNGLQHLLDRLRQPGSRPPRRLIFTGSTAVYGQTDGSEVDEGSPTEPADFGGRTLLAAESLLREASRSGIPCTVLRVAGIYGPGRHRLNAFRRGEATLRGDGHRWMNLIHRDDLVGSIERVLEHPTPGQVYNVSDGAPPTEAAFHQWLTSRLDLPPAPRAPAGAPVPGRRQRARTHKRVVNHRLREELGWEPEFPDFRIGYEALLAAGE